MLKQAKQQNVVDPLVDEEFSELDALDDANSMYMVRHVLDSRAAQVQPALALRNDHCTRQRRTQTLLVIL